MAGYVGKAGLPWLHLTHRSEDSESILKLPTPLSNTHVISASIDFSSLETYSS